VSLRIETAVRPITRGVSLVLLQLGISLRPLVFLSFALALLALALLAFLLSLYGYLYPGWMALLLILFLFGLVDGVEREMVREVKEGKNLLLLDRYLDLPLYLGSLFLLGDRLYLIAIDGHRLFVSSGEHLLLALTLSLGVVLLKTASLSLSRPLWGDHRAERVYLWLLFPAATAAYWGTFLEGLFLGALSLTVLLYLSLFYALLLAVPLPTVSLRGLSFRALRGLATLLSWLLFWIHRGLSRRLRLLLSWRPRLPHRRPYPIIPEPITPTRALDEFLPTYSYTVLVVDDNENPIPNVSVTLRNTEIGKEESLYTDPAGRANFFKVLEGTYWITLQTEEGRREEHERFISGNSGDAFTFSLSPGELSVVVSDSETSIPIPQAKVTLQTEEGEEIFRMTDEQGVAYFGSLPSRSLGVVVERSGYRPWKGKAGVEEGLLGVSMVREWEREDAGKGGRVMEAVERASEELGDSTLVLYAPALKPEEIIVQIAEGCRVNDREVFLVAEGEYLEGYRKALKRERKEEVVTLVRLLTTSTSKEKGKRKGEFSLRFGDPSTLQAVLEAMPAGSVLLLESLSGLVEAVGPEHALELLSGVIQTLRDEGLGLVALLEKGRIQGDSLEALQSRFTSLIEVEEDGLRKIR
jgi:hypothetical protein